VFCEKETGAARFQVRASADGTLPLEEAASLLAMHCLVRGQSPLDYQVMVRAGGSLFERVTMKARQLLEAGRAIAWRQVVDALTSRAIAFRSMRDNAEAATGAVWASKDDPRVTPLGRPAHWI